MSQRTRTGAQKRIYSRPPIPHVIGEVYGAENYFQSYVRMNVSRLRRTPTKAEHKMTKILKSLNGGALIGRFRFQHAISGRWIVDFFFPEVRLALEIDGPVHLSEAQRERDRLKNQDCKRFDITLVRFRNSEVFGDRDALVRKLRKSWRQALVRKNRIIGKEYISLRPGGR